MTDLVDQLRDVAHLAGHAAPAPPFEDLKTRARLRQQQRIGAVVAAAAAIVGLVVAAAALVWPTPSAPPADRPRPAKVDDERLLRRGDFVQPGFQAVEDVTGRAGHPACAGTSSGPRRTAHWREFRTFDIGARGYQVALSYTDAAAARRGVRAVEACPVMVTGATTLTSALTDLRGDGWQVRRLPARPDHPEVFAVARVGNVVAAVWVLGVHRVVATDGYAQGLLDRMRARLNGTSTRGVTPPPDALTAALVTKADAAALTGRSRIKVEYPAVYRSVHTCQPVPRSVIEWRHVQ